MEIPDIMHAETVAVWLDAAIDGWIEQGKNRSKRRFSDATGIPNGTLSNILRGIRKLDPAQVPAIVTVLQLDPYEGSVLEGLARLERNEDERSRVELDGRRRLLLSHRLSLTQLGLLDRWETVAIRELARLPDYQRDAEWIAARLRPRITVEQAERALAMLYASQADVDNTSAIVSTGMHAFTGVAADWHAQALDAAKASTALPREKRYYQAYISAVAPEAIPDLIAAITRFTEEVIGICERPRASALDRLVQVSFQLLPIFDPGDGDGLLNDPEPEG